MHESETSNTVKWLRSNPWAATKLHGTSFHHIFYRLRHRKIRPVLPIFLSLPVQSYICSDYTRKIVICLALSFVKPCPSEFSFLFDSEKHDSLGAHVRSFRRGYTFYQYQLETVWSFCRMLWFFSWAYTIVYLHTHRDVADEQSHCIRWNSTHIIDFSSNVIVNIVLFFKLGSSPFGSKWTYLIVTTITRSVLLLRLRRNRVQFPHHCIKKYAMVSLH